MKLCAWIVLHCVVQIAGRQALVGRTSRGQKREQKSVRFIEKDVSKTVDTAKPAAMPHREEEKWVVDSIYYDQYQSDSPATGDPVPDFCPPIPDVATDDACALNPCKSDADCAESERCCFNGCTYACLFEVKPVPVLDWRIEPRRFRSGISWLIDESSANPGGEAELCSTAPVGPDEDPLLCPHGYFCYIDDSTSKKANGKQRTRGICVKAAEKRSLEQEEEIALTSSLEGKKFCTIDNVVLLEGAKIRLVDKHCRCRKGIISCARYKRKRKSSEKAKKNKKDKKKDDSKKTKRRKRKRNKKKKDANATS